MGQNGTKWDKMGQNENKMYLIEIILVLRHPSRFFIIVLVLGV